VINALHQQSKRYYGLVRAISWLLLLAANVSLKLFMKLSFLICRQCRVLDQSAEGAEYNRQGQVRSEAEHVAPGQITKTMGRGLKG
jgi:hypothetical protein